jgi:hypothetical protein
LGLGDGIVLGFDGHKLTYLSYKVLLSGDRTPEQEVVETTCPTVAVAIAKAVRQQAKKIRITENGVEISLSDLERGRQEENEEESSGVPS